MSMLKNHPVYEVFEVTSREDYEALKKRGFDILFYYKNLRLNIDLRKELQEEIFGKGNHQERNQKYYRMAWEHSLTQNGQGHYCEECRKPLEKYSATYVSHILSRGAYPEMAYDLRNHNILCAQCHRNWECVSKRENMRIYNRNKSLIRQLKKDYNVNSD